MPWVCQKRANSCLLSMGGISTRSGRGDRRDVASPAWPLALYLGHITCSLCHQHTGILATECKALHCLHVERIDESIVSNCIGFSQIPRFVKHPDIRPTPEMRLRVFQ